MSAQPFFNRRSSDGWTPQDATFAVWHVLTAAGRAASLATSSHNRFIQPREGKKTMQATRREGEGRWRQEAEKTEEVAGGRGQTEGPVELELQLLNKHRKESLKSPE